MYTSRNFLNRAANNPIPCPHCGTTQYDDQDHVDHCWKNPINVKAICPNCKQHTTGGQTSIHLESCQIKFENIWGKVRCRFCQKNIPDTMHTGHVCEGATKAMLEAFPPLMLEDEEEGIEKCSECEAFNGEHFAICSKTPKCEECGQAINGLHFAICSKTPKCEECKDINGSHLPICSKTPKCEECKKSNGEHLAACSKMPKCSECKKNNGEHLAACSKLRRCAECNCLNFHSIRCSKSQKIRNDE